MFDSVLNQQKVARQRALGQTVSVLVHVAIIGGIIWWTTHKPKVDTGPKAVPVAFLAAKPAPTAKAPPPPPPPPPKHHPHPKTPVIKKPLVIPKEIPKEKPPEKPPDPTPPDDSDDDSDDDDGVEGGVEGGVKGGVVGGVVGGQLQGGGDQPVFFGEGMTKPVMDPDASESFHWKREQLDAHIEGLCLVTCVINKDGTLDVKQCKILKRIPQVDDAQILDYLAHLKFHPALQGGKPISLKGFTIPLRLKAE